MEDLNGGEERVLQVRGAAEARTEMQKHDLPAGSTQTSRTRGQGYTRYEITLQGLLLIPEKVSWVITWSLSNSVQNSYPEIFSSYLEIENYCQALVFSHALCD